jgi:nucleotide-binding universal stress UspA family protein
MGTIVVGVDGSTPSRRAVEWAVRRAASTGSDVLLVHVMDDDPNAIRSIGGGSGSARLFIEREVAHAGSLDPGVAVRGELRVGSPMRELSAASAGADLVVVGTNKTGFVHGKVFGSRSLQLAGGSSVPVAVIPESPVNARHGIVAGVDESPASAAAIEFAAAEARITRQPLTLVRAWGWAEGIRNEPDEQQRLHNDRSDAVAEELLATAALTVGDETVAHRRVVHRPPAEALTAAAASAALLVLGSSRRSGPERMMLGSVSHDVLINIAGPTIIVHADDQPAPLERNDREDCDRVRVDVRQYPQDRGRDR